MGGIMLTTSPRRWRHTDFHEEDGSEPLDGNRFSAPTLAKTTLTLRVWKSGTVESASLQASCCPGWFDGKHDHFIGETTAFMSQGSFFRRWHWRKNMLEIENRFYCVLWGSRVWFEILESAMFGRAPVYSFVVSLADHDALQGIPTLPNGSVHTETYHWALSILRWLATGRHAPNRPIAADVDFEGAGRWK